MKTDNYTKVILSIIALCLTITIMKDFQLFPSAHASEHDKSTEVPSNYFKLQACARKRNRHNGCAYC